MTDAVVVVAAAVQSYMSGCNCRLVVAVVVGC